MIHSEISRKGEREAIAFSLFALLAWSLIAAATVLWTHWREQQQIINLATKEAQANFQKDLAFREWATRHGGVYVPIDKRTPPNPYLSHLPHRDVTTGDGLRLTLMNPAYMMRQMTQEFEQEYGIKGSITALRLLNPDNEPDPWERRVLEGFQTQPREVVETTDIDDQPYLRLMRPMFMTEGCVKCHGFMGFKEGDLRGGISVSVPLAPYLADAHQITWVTTLLVGILWSLGAVGILRHTKARLHHIDAQRQAEAVIQEGRESYRLLLDSTAEGIYGVDQNGVCTFANTSCLQLLGYAELESLVGRHMHDLIHHTRPDGSPCPEGDCPLYEAYHLGVGVKRGDERFFRTDGSAFPVEYAAHPIRRGDQLLGAVVTFTDITARRQAEQSLKKSEERFSLAVQGSSDGLWDWYDIDNDRLWWSQHLFEMLGLDPQEGAPSFAKFLSLVHPEDVKATLAAVSRHLEERVPFRIEYRVRVSSGQYRWFLGRGQALWDETGKPVRMSGSFQDITERKNAEDSLRSLVRRYDAILFTTQDGFCIVDSAGRIQEVNDAYCRMTGYAREELTAMALHELEVDADPQETRLSRIMAQGWGQFTTVQRHKEGGLLQLEVSITYARFDEGGFLCAFLRDIGERLRMEERLRNSQKLEAVGTLAGGVAHDLNNLLSPILGYAEMGLMDAQDGGGMQRFLMEIHQASQRARDLVAQLLTFSRRTTKEMQPVSLGVIVKESLRLLRATVPATISLQSRLEAGSATVMADPVQMQQVVINLVTNAVQSLDGRGEVKIHLRHQEPPPSLVKGSNGPWLALSVQDNGAGIDPAIQGRIFEPFFTTKPVGKGTGLGLSVVHGVVSECNGAIQVESSLGAGATFTVYLPELLEAELPPVDPKSLPRQVRAHVLLVDDEPTVLAVEELILRKLGCTVEATQSPQEALQWALSEKGRRFQLVITDQAMPGMSGRELGQAIMARWPELPVVICTGFSDTITAASAQEMGFKGYLQKPVSIAELSALLVERLGLGKAVES